MSWANVRAKRDMQILWTSGPNTGSFSFQRSASCLPRVEPRKVRIPKISEPIPTTRKYHSLRTKSETSIRNSVAAGNLAQNSWNVSSKIGTTHTIRNDVIENTIQNTITG